jgi:hypothetical protein
MYPSAAFQESPYTPLAVVSRTRCTLVLLFKSRPTLPSQWFLAPAGLYAYQPLHATDSVNSDVSSKEGAVLGTRKFHQGHH